MDFLTASKYAVLLAKNYAEEVFRLLVNYQSISASEVAARLDLHIKTAQDFLEGWVELGILSKEEITEKKRPYYRYTLKQNQIVIDIDLLQARQAASDSNLAALIREKENSGARFATARGDDAITHVTIWSGNGRERSERKIKLTAPQGKFLYHLPFPKATPLAIAEIMAKASLGENHAPEVIDLVRLLENYDVIENLPA